MVEGTALEKRQVGNPGAWVQIPPSPLQRGCRFIPISAPMTSKAETTQQNADFFRVGILLRVVSAFLRYPTRSSLTISLAFFTMKKKEI